MHVLIENETWDLVDVSKGVKPIGCIWVYKVKYNIDGSIKYKAQLVVKGYAQQHGIDYYETLALVATMMIVCVLLAIALGKGWYHHQVDVNNAFLQGELEKLLYMVQPPGFQFRINTNIGSFETSNMSHFRNCPLKKGIKQVPRKKATHVYMFFKNNPKYIDFQHVQNFRAYKNCLNNRHTKFTK